MPNTISPLVCACVKISFVFVLQHDVCNLPASDSVGAAYTHPLVAKTGGSESKVSCDSKHSSVSSLSLGSLMSPRSTWSSSGGGSSSSGRMCKVRCRPKRRASQFDEDQENINPAAVCDSVVASDQLVGFDKAGSWCRLPASKRHCSKETDAGINGKNDSIVDSLANDEGQSGSDISLISRVVQSSCRCDKSKASTDITIKSALNRSDDRLHELIGDFSRPYCLPFIESDKHRDLKSISCHTVSSDSSSLHCRLCYWLFHLLL